MCKHIPAMQTPVCVQRLICTWNDVQKMKSPISGVEELEQAVWQQHILHMSLEL